MKKVMVFGTFDLLHRGHLNFFQQAKEHGDYLIVVIARDKTVQKLKRKPHHSEKERLAIVKPHVDKVILGNLRDRHKVIEKYQPDVICLGYDQRFFLDILKNYKIPVKKMKSYYPGKYKSSKLLKKLKD